MAAALVCAMLSLLQLSACMGTEAQEVHAMHSSSGGRGAGHPRQLTTLARSAASMRQTDTMARKSCFVR